MENHPEPLPTLQLRIDFPQPASSVTLGLTLRGLSVVGAPWEGSIEDAAAYLQAAGIRPRFEPDRGLVFPLTDIRHLPNLPPQVQLEPLGPLTPLVRYVLTAPEAPGTVTLSGGRLRLSWFDGPMRHEEVLEDLAAAALAPSELPFVATEEAWARLERLSGLPLSLGRVQLNHDGFLEISTNKPQRLEAAPLPGLFRIDATHYGMATAFVKEARNITGLEWAGVIPRDVTPPSPSAALLGQLGSHLHEDLGDLAARLTARRGQILVYGSGLGRRVLALAALEVLDAYPALVVAPPWALWVWQRNADLLGRSTTLSGTLEGDLRLLTYFDLTLKPRLDGFAGIVFDDLAGPDAQPTAARAALEGLTMMDAYRVAICGEWPADPEEAIKLLETVRPGEFALADQPLVRRYPLHPLQRAKEHAAVYLMHRTTAGDSDASRHRRSEAIVVPPHPQQLAALAALEQATDQRARLTEATEIVSAGTTDTVSPKIAIAIAIVAQARLARRRVAIVTRATRAAPLLRASLAAHGATFLDSGTSTVESSPVTIVLWTQRLPDLRQFDDVIFLDYPWSSLLIDEAVGSAANDLGARRVVILHMPGTVDDRLAVYAARRRERGATIDPADPPEGEDLEYLLARRW